MSPNIDYNDPLSARTIHHRTGDVVNVSENIYKKLFKARFIGNTIKEHIKESRSLTIDVNLPISIRESKSGQNFPRIQRWSYVINDNYACM